MVHAGCVFVASVQSNHWKKMIEVFTFCLHGWCMLGVFFTFVAGIQSNHWGSHIPSSWMVHAGCVFVASIHPKELLGNESEPMLTPREKSPLPEKFSSEGDRTHDADQAGQRAQHTTNELLPTPPPHPFKKETNPGPQGRLTWLLGDGWCGDDRLSGRGLLACLCWCWGLLLLGAGILLAVATSRAGSARHDDGHDLLLAWRQELNTEHGNSLRIFHQSWGKCIGKLTCYTFFPEVLQWWDKWLCLHTHTHTHTLIHTHTHTHTHQILNHVDSKLAP